MVKCTTAQFLTSVVFVIIGRDGATAACSASTQPCYASNTPTDIDPWDQGLGHTGVSYFLAKDGYCCDANGRIGYTGWENPPAGESEGNGQDWLSSPHGCISMVGLDGKPQWGAHFNNGGVGRNCNGHFNYHCWCKVESGCGCNTVQELSSDTSDNTANALQLDMVKDVCGTCGGSETVEANCPASGGGSLGSETTTTTESPATSTTTESPTTTTESPTTTTESPTTTTTQLPTTTTEPVLFSRMTSNYDISLKLDTDTCGDLLIAQYGPALRRTVSQISGVTENNIYNITITGGNCKNRRRSMSSTDGNSVHLYGKYVLSFVVMLPSDEAVKEVSALLTASVVGNNGTSSSGDASNATTPSFADSMINNMASQESCSYDGVGNPPYAWIQPLRVVDGTTYFPFSKKVGSEATAELVASIVSKQNITQGIFDCEMYSGLYIALCDADESFAFEKILVEIATSESIEVTTSSNDTATFADDSSDDERNRDPLMISLVVVAAVLFLLGVSYGLVLVRQRLGSAVKKGQQLATETNAKIAELANDNLLLQHGWVLKSSEVSLASKIGFGSAGEVWRGKLRNSLDVAVKLLEGSENDDALDSNKEISLLRLCRYPKLVLFLGYGKDDAADLGTKGRAFIVFEYMNEGGLDRKLWYASPPPRWSDRMRWLVDVADGMEYLHEKMKCSHRDLKSPNVLLSFDSSSGKVHAKIADFGMSIITSTKRKRKYGELAKRAKKSRRMTRFGGTVNASSIVSREEQDKDLIHTQRKFSTQDGESSNDEDSEKAYWTSQNGTIEWLPPELMDDSPAPISLKIVKSDDRADHYSFGCLMYEIVELRPPWSHDVAFRWASSVRDTVVAGNRPPVTRSDAPSGYLRLMDQCWRQLAKKRPKFSTILRRLRSMKDIFKEKYKPSHALLLGDEFVSASTTSTTNMTSIAHASPVMERTATCGDMKG